MFCVFNSAHKNSAIAAKSASVRLLGLNLPYEEARAMCEGPIETRIWPMSGPKEQNWRALTNINLSECSETLLQEEYDSIEQRIADFVALRTRESDEVYTAMENKVMRPVYQVRAEKLLYEAKMAKKVITAMKEPSITAMKEPSITAMKEPSITAMKEPSMIEQPKFVPSMPRSSEIRGQQWALIGLYGDAAYEVKKKQLLEDLGRSYFDALRRAVPEAMSDAEAEALYTAGSVEDSLGQQIAECAAGLEALVEEPCICFFDAAEQPESLVKKSKALSELPELRHVDLAVVRMYSWLSLRFLKSNAIERTSRDPKSEEFYKLLRSSQNTDCH